MMKKLEKEVVEKCGSLNKDDCLKAVLCMYLLQNVRYEQISVLIHKKGGVPEAVCTVFGWNIKSMKNAITLKDMINIDKVSTSPSEWLCVLLLLKNPTNIYEDSGLLVAMDHCYMLCVTHACDTGDPWVPWMMPFLPQKHTVNLNNLLITALLTKSPVGIDKNIDTMQVVKGVVSFFKEPDDSFFYNIFPDTARWNAHALNLWISLLILVDVTEGYQVYLKCQEWTEKEESEESEEEVGGGDGTDKFVNKLQPHLKKIGGSVWRIWQSKFLTEILLKDGVRPLLNKMHLTELFRIKEMFHKPLIEQLTKKAIDKRKERKVQDPDKDPTHFAPQKLPKNTDEVEGPSWWPWTWGDLSSQLGALLKINERTQVPAGFSARQVVHRPYT